MTRRAQSSKRRWIARAKAGKWVPVMVVIVLDRGQDLHERWEFHPEDSRFLRMRKTTSPQNSD